MMRLLGVQIPDGQRIEYALTHIYGIGPVTSHDILISVQIDPSTRTDKLTQDEVKKLQEFIEKNYKVEGDLREEIRQSIKRLRETGTYRGLRHFHGLPARGQRTRSNARTKRGKRRTVGAMKKEDAQRVQKAQTGTQQKGK